MAEISSELYDRSKTVIEHVACGLTVQAALELLGISSSEFYKAISGVNELAASYARAKEIRADLNADEIITIADDRTLDPQQARNMIDVRKWRASKQHARVYGDRIDVQVGGQINVLEIMTRATLQSIRNLAPIDEAQIVDVPAISTSNTSDVQSEGQAKDEPSIFD